MSYAVRFEEVSKRYRGGGPRYPSLRHAPTQGRVTWPGAIGGTDPSPGGPSPWTASHSRSRKARRSPSSGPTAPARRPPSSSSRGSPTPPAAACASLAASAPSSRSAPACILGSPPARTSGSTARSSA